MKANITEKLKPIITKVKDAISFKKPILAVDIGSSAIKSIRIKSEGNQYAADFAAYKELDMRSISGDEEAMQIYMIGEIKKMLSDAKLKKSPIAIGISGSSVIVREAKLPAIGHQELERTLPFEAEPFIPYDIRDVNLDYYVIKEIVEENQKKYDTVLVAAKKDLIDGRLSILAQAGLRPIIVDVDAFAVTNLLSLVSDQQSQQTTLMVNIGSTITNLVIVEDGTPRVVRDVNIGGNAFTNAIESSLGQDAQASEKMKRDSKINTGEDDKEGTLSSGEPADTQASQCLITVANELLAEVHKSIDFYLTHGMDREITKIYLSGGGALLKNLDAYLSKEFKLPVEILNPLSLLKIPPAYQNLIQAGPAFSVACGLALRKYGDWQK
ncbi:type IV pilus assembly protein PilM [Elusimicrobiota bacterium]